MKKFIILFIVSIVGVLGSNAQTYTLSGEGTIAKGKAGVIAVNLENTDGVRGVQFALILPGTLTFESMEVTDRTIGFNVSKGDNGIVTISKGDETPIAPGTGAIAYINVTAAAEATTETSQVSFSNIRISLSGTEQVQPSDIIFNVTITDRIILDENSTVLPAAQENVDVTVNRTLKGGYWNTICLPFATTVEQLQTAIGNGAIFCGLTDCTQEGNSFILSFTTFPATRNIRANFPLLVRTTADIASFPVENVTISNSTNDRIVVDDEMGDTKAKFIGTHKAGTTIPNNHIFLGAGDNKFYYSTGNTTIKGFRGYFYVAGFEASSSAPQLSLVIDGETTSIYVPHMEGNAFTIEDGKIYDLKGMQVDNPQKGIYIQNGKKIVIK